jgi:hypothetical protein
VSTLPLHRLELRGSLNGDQHQLSWIIDADEQVVQQILEISTDGRTFLPVVEPSTAARAYVYTPAITNTAQYRLNVTFDDGRQYYSNIVTLRKVGITARPVLLTNLVYNSSVTVISPGNYHYNIYDFNGKEVSKGQLTNGTNYINAAQTGGIYMIRFSSGSEVWTDKFVRQ